MAEAKLPWIVPPLVRRHAEDAAFYWNQLDDAPQATGLHAQRLLHFQRMLAAHLAGLQVAGDAATPLTQEALSRWRKPGEVFAASVTALAVPGTEAQARALVAVLQTIRRAPDLLLRGLISALAWTNLEQAEPWLRTALLTDEVVSRVAALRACALHGLSIEQWSGHADHASPHVRAAACRAARDAHLDALIALRSDPDLAVRAEASLACARLIPRPSEGTATASFLWRCVSEQIVLTQQATGWNRLQAQRRLNRWLRHLAWLVPLDHPGVPQLLARIPPRLALSFVLHHGDPAHLDFVLRAMREPESARWALWVWRCLTGIDPLSASLTLPDPLPDLDAPLSAEQQDADHGLPLPDPAAVAEHPASRGALPTGQRVLMGQPVQALTLRALLDPAADQPQALRFVAAHALEQLHPAYALNLRASPEAQTAQLARMRIA